MLDDTYDKIFDQNFDDTLFQLTTRSEAPDFAIEDVNEELHHLYIYEGQDWGGRGELKQAEISGMILAYQAFLKRFGSDL